MRLRYLVTLKVKERLFAGSHIDQSSEKDATDRVYETPRMEKIVGCVSPTYVFTVFSDISRNRKGYL